MRVANKSRMAILLHILTLTMIRSLELPKMTLWATGRRGFSCASSLQMNVNGGKTRTATSLPDVPENAHRMVLMRHGESEFNNANVFTGWCDVALTQRGECHCHAS
jgi:hypothetical protein